MPVSRTDLALAVLYAADNTGLVGAKVIGITRLEKLVFMLQAELQSPSLGQLQDTFQFEPYKMGPFSEEIYDEVDFLSALGLVQTTDSGQRDQAQATEEAKLFADATLDKYMPAEVRESDEAQVYSLTEKGVAAARNAWERLSPEQQKLVAQIKQRFNRMPLKQLLRFVYKKYPEMTTKSEIKDYLGLQ